MKGRRFKKMIKKKIVKKKIVKKANEPEQAKEPIVEGEIEPRIVTAIEAPLQLLNNLKSLLMTLLSL